MKKKLRKVFAGVGMIWNGGVMFLWAEALLMAGITFNTAYLFVGALLMQVIGFAQALSKNKRTAGMVLICIGTLALVGMMIAFADWDWRMITAAVLAALYMLVYVR